MASIGLQNFNFCLGLSRQIIAISRPDNGRSRAVAIDTAIISFFSDKLTHIDYCSSANWTVLCAMLVMMVINKQSHDDLSASRMRQLKLNSN